MSFRDFQLFCDLLYHCYETNLWLLFEFIIGGREIEVLWSSFGTAWKVPSRLSSRDQLDGWIGFKIEESWRIGGGQSEGGVGKACGKSRPLSL